MGIFSFRISRQIDRNSDFKLGDQCWIFSIKNYILVGVLWSGHGGQYGHVCHNRWWISIFWKWLRIWIFIVFVVKQISDLFTEFLHIQTFFFLQICFCTVWKTVRTWHILFWDQNSYFHSHFYTWPLRTSTSGRYYSKHAITPILYIPS